MTELVILLCSGFLNYQSNKRSYALSLPYSFAFLGLKTRDSLVKKELGTGQPSVQSKYR